MNKGSLKIGIICLTDHLKPFGLEILNDLVKMIDLQRHMVDPLSPVLDKTGNKTF